MSRIKDADILSRRFALSKDDTDRLVSIAQKMDSSLSSILVSNGELLSPGLVKRSRVYADLSCYVGSMTKQEFAADCDINNIVKNFMKTGQLPLSKRMPHYGDFTSALDFQSSLHVVIRAQEQFSSLPADVRKRFGNDPAEFLDFINNPENAQEAIKLGLATEVVPDPTPEPQKVFVVNSDTLDDMSNKPLNKK